MPWPLRREDIDRLIAESLADADDSVRLVWDRIRTEPEKWRCSPWGDAGGGFWVVAIRNGMVLWFNDIEEGFQTTPFTTHGVIDDYTCNLTSLATILANLPEALEAEAYAGAHAASSVPSKLDGPGRILRRQTTYWTLEPQAGPPVRVHFSGKQEAHFDQDSYASMTLLDRHSLVVEYDEPWVKVLVSGAKQCPPGFLDMLGKRVTLATGGWREPSRYLRDRGDVLRDGFGCLMVAPVSLADWCAECVRACGASAAFVPECPARPGCRVLLLGRSFVIARAFRFEAPGAAG